MRSPFQLLIRSTVEMDERGINFGTSVLINGHPRCVVPVSGRINRASTVAFGNAQNGNAKATAASATCVRVTALSERSSRS